MKSDLTEKLREFLLECYGEDINEAKSYFSTSNYAFIFPNKPFMIRVSVTQRRTRQEILSELLWVDDLKTFKETICEPEVSLRGNLLEEIEIDGQIYRASMFRTARGKVTPPSEMSPMYFICVGELLGAIHAASRNEVNEGIRYQRPAGSEAMDNLVRKVEDKLPEQVMKKICDIKTQVHAIPQSEEKYGMCHGDFHTNNFFVEANNIWVFDFDSSIYSYYMYDIVSFLQDCLMNGYKKEKDARTCLYEDILPYFKIGYELHMKVEEQFYDNLELFMFYRAARIVCNLQLIQVCGVVDDLNGIRELYYHIVCSEDIFEAISDIRNKIAHRK